MQSKIDSANNRLDATTQKLNEELRWVSSYWCVYACVHAFVCVISGVCWSLVAGVSFRVNVAQFDSNAR